MRRAAWPLLLVTLLGPAPVAAAADPDRGQRLYLRYCQGCHGADGRGGAHTFMPHVEALTRKGYIDQVPDEWLFLAITGGGAAIGKNTYMPAWRGTLDDQAVHDIIAHIRRLPIY
jgi:mono/diheme cytochrome c family protein